jgi:hypothetical protein
MTTDGTDDIIRRESPTATFPVMYDATGEGRLYARRPELRRRCAYRCGIRRGDL